jgi:hypothetical protein
MFNKNLAEILFAYSKYEILVSTIIKAMKLYLA